MKRALQAGQEMSSWCKRNELTHTHTRSSARNNPSGTRKHQEALVLTPTATDTSCFSAVALCDFVSRRTGSDVAACTGIGWLHERLCGMTSLPILPGVEAERKNRSELVDQMRGPSQLHYDEVCIAIKLCSASEFSSIDSPGLHSIFQRAKVDGTSGNYCCGVPALDRRSKLAKGEGVNYFGRFA